MVCIMANFFLTIANRIGKLFGLKECIFCKLYKKIFKKT